MFQHGARSWRLRYSTIGAIAAIAAFASAAGAADVRHYEQVSPADKGLGDIVGDGETTIASSAGNAVAFSSRTPFGDTIGSGVDGQTQYVARRTEAGWSTHAITPMPAPDALQTLFAQTKLQTFSDDLGSAVVWAYDLPDVSGDTPARNNIYVEDTATRALQPITVSQADPIGPFDFLNMADWGVSADAKHVAFVIGTRLLGNAAPGVTNVYQWDRGVLSLAGILPDETVPAGGSDIVPEDYRGAMSADGTRLIFTAAPNGNPQLYMRIDGRRTVWISQPEGSDTSDPANVSFQAMTPDGRSVFFVTDSPLLDSDTSPGPDLYRYTDSPDPANDGNLTLISHDGNVVGDANDAVVGVSDDGARVYYQTSSNQLVSWDNGVSRVISSDVQKDPEPTFSLSVTASRPGLGRVTPDGMWLAFVTRSTAGNDQIHGLTGTVTNGHYEMYLYSLAADRLSCVTCPSGPATSDVSVVPGVTSGLPEIFNDAVRPQFLDEDGKVFFSTADSLVPQDRNGVTDAYEYDPADGTVQLLSTGKGSDPATFADASANGDDVFILTRQQLVPTDHDDLVDVYDARVGPAPPVQGAAQASPCEGDACQPSPSASPPDVQLGSLSLVPGPNPATTPRALAIPRTAVVRGAAGVVRVRVFVAGTLKWHGGGVLAGSVKRTRGGAYSVRLRLDRHARAQLMKRGRYATRVRLTLALPDGGDVSGITRVTFRSAARKGR